MPEHFRTRLDMVEWLIANCPRPSIVRALKANRVEFLGGFTKIPPSNLPGWIFKVVLESGKVKNVCILCNDLKHKYEIRLVKHVPWDQWNGVFYQLIRENSINTGDDPLQYRRLYNAAISARQIKNQ